MPGISVMKTSLSACSAMAVEVATSSIERLKASPVGEKPKGLSSTRAPDSMKRRMAVWSTRRTRPLCMKSTPSTMPTGLAVRKLPDTTRTVELAIGVLGRPCENAASISKRSWPAASCAASSATGSVMRMPCEKRDTWPLAASCSVTWGRKPCTSTSLMPMACRMERSCTKVLSLPAAMASPARPTTKVLPR
jgi:hypothetical protein